MKLLLRAANSLIRGYFVFRKNDSSMTCRPNGVKILYLLINCNCCVYWASRQFPRRKYNFLSRYLNMAHLPTTTILGTDAYSFAGDAR